MAKATISNLLNIDNNNSWDIIDSNGSLSLIHYNDDSNLLKYGHLRGMVIDTDKKKIVCKSYEYTPTAVLDELTIHSDNKLYITDTAGLEHVFEQSQLNIKRGFDGTIIRVFKYNGKVYHSTHRRLDITRSRWGNSIFFKQMYQQLNGPTDDELFDPQELSSPYVYIFLIVHPDILNVTKEPITNGYIVYLGNKVIDHSSTENGKKLNIKTPPNLTITEANHHLRFGFQDQFDDSKLDKRMRPGEFVILYKLNEQGEVIELLKVISTAYQWRLQMRDNNPNLNNRFYQLLDYATKDIKEYMMMFPILTRYSVPYITEYIKNNGSFKLWSCNPEFTQNSILQTKEDRIYNIWLAFLMAVPLHRQQLVSTMYNDFIKDKTAVINWLCSLEKLDTITIDVPDRVKTIITIARNFAQQKLSQGLNKTRNGKILTLKQLINDCIRNIISKEYGSSLYRIVKSYHNSLKPQPIIKNDSTA